MKNIFIASFLITLAACSSAPEKIEKPKYSQETLDFFNRIETTNGRIKEVRIDESQKTRRDNLDSGDDLKNIVIDDKNYNQSPSEKPQHYKRPKIITPNQMSDNDGQRNKQNHIFEEKSNESLIEIEQHISYYCMNKRNLSRFRNSTDVCTAFTNNVLAKCIPDKKRVNKSNVICVTKSLSGK